MDDSTAEVNSTALSPRRPQDFNDFRAEWASTLLDRRQRFSFDLALRDAVVPEGPRTGSSGTCSAITRSRGRTSPNRRSMRRRKAAVDSNQNGDAAADRVIVNTAGTPGLSSDVTMLCKGGPCSSTRRARGRTSWSRIWRTIPMRSSSAPERERSRLRAGISSDAGDQQLRLQCLQELRFTERVKLNCGRTSSMGSITRSTRRAGSTT